MIDIAKDVNDFGFKWACDNLGIDVKNDFTVVIRKDRDPIGAIIFTLYSPFNCYISLFTTDKSWCNRTVLTFIYEKCFKDFKVKKITCLADRKNKQSRTLLEKLGLKLEGINRFNRDNGNDECIYGLTKTDYFKFIKKR